jgi:hypothetical protein
LYLFPFKEKYFQATFFNIMKASNIISKLIFNVVFMEDLLKDVYNGNALPKVNNKNNK